jgi:hypothetical protein
MTIINDIEIILDPLNSFIGSARTGTEPPYVVIRPLFLGTAEDAEALSGDALGWDQQISVYCCGASVEASYNLALSVMALCQAKRAGGYVMGTSMGYVGAAVEGHYESQVTIQMNQGEIS